MQFFFTVYTNNMFYALCVDTRKDKIFILDSTIDNTADCDISKYQKVYNDVVCV